MTGEKSVKQQPRARAGAILFLIMVASPAFLVVSPYLENGAGSSIEDRCLAEAETRILETRAGPIRVHVVYSGNGSNAAGVNVTYDHVQHEFLFGAMLFHYDMNSSNNDIYANLWKNVFNYATLHFYYVSWDTPDYYPEEARINDTIRFCEANDIAMKGHCLAWNHEAGIPGWLVPIGEHDNDEIVADFERRITGLVGKYRDNITYWDVANEVVHRGVFNDLDPAAFTHQCFSWARDANPGARLVFNEYAMLGHEFGHGDVARFCETLTARGTPYDIIGMQAHAMDSDWIPMYEVLATLDGFSRLGKQIHLTELMVPSTPVPITNSWKKGLWSEENQAEYLRRLYTVAFSHPAVSAITYWGFEEPSRNDGYGLVGHDFTPKVSYNVLKSLIHDTWDSKGSGVTDNDGWIDFRGFHGKYNITINGIVYQITSTTRGPNEFQVEL